MAWSIFRWSKLGCLGSKSLSCDVHYESGHRSQSVVHIRLSCYFQDLAYFFIKLLPLNSLGGFGPLDPWLDRRGTASCYDCSLLALEALWVVERCCFLDYVAGELLAAGVSDTRRLWALWVASGPGSCCVLPEVASVYCVAVSALKHLILP